MQAKSYKVIPMHNRFAEFAPWSFHIHLRGTDHYRHLTSKTLEFLGLDEEDNAPWYLDERNYEI